MNFDDRVSSQKEGGNGNPIECRLFRFDMMKGSVRDKL